MIILTCSESSFPSQQYKYKIPVAAVYTIAAWNTSVWFPQLCKMKIVLMELHSTWVERVMKFSDTFPLLFIPCSNIITETFRSSLDLVARVLHFNRWMNIHLESLVGPNC